MERTGPWTHAGIVDQDVQPAAPVEDGRDDVGARLLTAYVVRRGERAPTGGGDGFGGRLRLVGVDVGDDHLGAVRGQRFGDGAPDAPGGAGYQCDLIRQCHGFLLVSGSCW